MSHFVVEKWNGLCWEDCEWNVVGVFNTEDEAFEFINNQPEFLDYKDKLISLKDGYYVSEFVNDKRINYWYGDRSVNY